MIEWKNRIITLLISVLILTAGYIIYDGFMNYTNNLAYQSYVQGANENMIRITQTIQDELSIPTIQIDEATNQSRIVWIELERVCSGSGG